VVRKQHGPNGIFLYFYTMQVTLISHGLAHLAHFTYLLHHSVF